MNAFLAGELVDVSLRGARVVAAERIDSREILRVAIGSRELELPIGTGAQVKRVAPAEWPPQQGDVWEDAHGGSWWAIRNAKGVELQADGSGGMSDASFVLDRYGPMSLAYRKGWSPAHVPAMATPEQLDRRAEVIAGLREMADWYEANPDVPMRPYGFENLHSISTPTEDSDRAELFRIAGLFGEDPDLTASHPCVRKIFRGGVGVRAYYIPATKDDEDVTRGGREVGASAGVTGAPTSPPYATDDRPLPRLVHPAPITDPALRGDA